MLTTGFPRLTRACGVLALCCGLLAAPLAAPAHAASGPNVERDESSLYLRVVEEKGKSIALEIATRDFVPAVGEGPRVGLVAVAHIADAAFYESIAKLVEEYDLVLYESVKPPGTGGAGGETDEQRIKSTKAAMQFVGAVIESYYAEKSRYPADLDRLAKFAARQDPRLVQFLQTAGIDGWGNTLIYQTITDEDDEITGYTLTSHGADGAPGGEGADADIHLADQPPPDALLLSQDDGLQSQLASALKLRFQLDSLPYHLPNWRCSDMAMDELNRRFVEKGLDFNMLGGTLAGSSLPATLIRMLLGFIRMADAFTEGAVTDTMKVVMIEMLGNPAMLDEGLSQLGKGFGEIIINDRNQVVIDDLKRVIEKEPEIKSIALLYGAAHMPDFAQRLSDQLGYEPLPEERTHWLAAIRVDLEQSKVSPAQLEQIRTMMKRAMQQQLRRR